jgi:hypothetical protein
VVTPFVRPGALGKEALRKSEEWFVLFMEHLPGTAWIKDVKGRYV